MVSVQMEDLMGCWAVIDVALNRREFADILALPLDCL